MESDTIINMGRCPRCNEPAYEVFKTHDCCHECNYSSLNSDSYRKDNIAVPQWAIEEFLRLKNEKKSKKDAESQSNVVELHPPKAS